MKSTCLLEWATGFPRHYVHYECPLPKEESPLYKLRMHAAHDGLVRFVLCLQPLYAALHIREDNHAWCPH